MESRENQKQIIEKYAIKTISWIKGQLQEKELVASGKLSNSVKEDLFESKNELGAEISALSYFRQIDKGRARGRYVSYDRIKDWIIAKNITSEFYPKHTLDEFAAIIGNSIKEKGTIKRFGYNGSGIMNEMVKEFSEDFFTDITNALAKDMGITFDEMLQKLRIITKVT